MQANLRRAPARLCLRPFCPPTRDSDACRRSASSRRRSSSLSRGIRGVMAAHAQSELQAGPRQMLQLEDYSLPSWAEALSDHV